MSKFDFDQLLSTCGEFGRYQIVIYILIGLCGLPTGWQNLLMVFIGGRQDHWCSSSDENVTLATPVGSENDYRRQCMYYGLNYTGFDDLDVGNYSSTAYDIYENDSSLLVKCNLWEYDTSGYKTTITSQWNLVCDNDYMVSLATSIYMTGFLTGAVTFGSISDIIGRKKTLLICIVLEIVSTIAAAITSQYGHYAPFVILRFIVGNAVAGCWTVAFVIVMEIAGGVYRMYLGILFQCWFACGFVSLCGIAYLIRDHFPLQLCVALPVIGLLSYYWVLPESPRWLYAENRSSEAEKIMRTIAKHNNKPFPTELSKFHKEDTTIDHHQERATLLDILRRRRMRNRLICVSFVWFVTSLVYYGLSYNADALGGDLYMNAAISSSVEIPACIVMSFLLNRFGRRWILFAMSVTAGVALLAIIPALQNPALQPLVITLANIGKFGSSASFAVVYVFTAELFPTVVRNVAVGSGSMCARVGGLLAPQLVYLDKQAWFGLSAVIMGALSLVAAVLVLTLPETNKARLPETLEDGEGFGTKAYKRVFYEEYVNLEKSPSKTADSFKERGAMVETA